MSSQESEHKGRTYLVTGASAGMGAGAARFLASRGAKVALFARRQDRLDALVAEIKRGGGQALAVAGDVTSKADNQRAVDAAVEKFGALHGAFLNAGLYRGQTPLVESSDADVITPLLDVNVRGVIYGLQTALPAIKASADGSGAVVVNSSVMGAVTKGASAGSSIYGATKAFVNSLVQTAAVEHAGEVRINAIAPGVIHTEIFGEEFKKEQADGFAESMQLIKRAGRVDEISQAVSFLVGPLSSFTTGSVVTIDGGWQLA